MTWLDLLNILLCEMEGAGSSGVTAAVVAAWPGVFWKCFAVVFKEFLGIQGVLGSQ